MDSQLTNLSILYTGHDEYHFLLSRFSEGNIFPAEGFARIKVDHALIEGLCSSLRQTAENDVYSGGSRTAAFMKIGKTLYRQIAGDKGFAKFEKELQKPDTYLLISTNEPDVPWELLYNGEEFLGIRHIVSRQLYREGATFASLPIKDMPKRCLIIANPTEDAPELEAQASLLVDWLGEKIDCTYMRGKQATCVDVTMELASEYDIVLYSGHVQRVDNKGNKVSDKETGEYALVLNDGPLRASAIERAIEGISIAFINGCRSAVSIESLTEAFISRGTLIVVGTLFEIPPIGARRFAEKFYRSILAGDMVGSSLRKARYLVQNDPVCGTAWASFVMYGSPLLRIVAEPIIIEENTQPSPSREVFLSKQDLPEWLSKENFQDGCWRVVEDAINHARTTRLLGTPMLFAAMLKGKDSGMRGALEELGADPKLWQKVFDKALEFAEKISPHGDKCSKLAFSESAERILRRAQELAKKRGDKQGTRERDLQKAFVDIGGGTIGRLLRTRLDFSMLSAILESIDSILNSNAELIKERFDDSGKQVIDAGLEIACEMGSRVFGSPHLFWGLASLQNGIVQKLLQEQGIKPEQIKAAVIAEYAISGLDPAVKSVVNALHLSANLMLILQQANRIARFEKAEKINDRHLVSSFLIMGGGSFGQVLRKIGLDPDVMKCGVGVEIKLQNSLGSVKLEECSAACWDVIKQSMEVAVRSGTTTVSTVHLFLALLTGEAGCADVALRKQCVSPDRFRTELLYAIMPKSAIGKDCMKQPNIVCSKSVRRILQLAKQLVETGDHEELIEAILWQAFVQYGGGNMREYLHKQGVVWELLLSDILLEDGHINAEAFDEKPLQALRAALDSADRMRQGMIGTPHLLLGMLSVEDGLLQAILSEQSIRLTDVVGNLEREYTLAAADTVEQKLELASPFLSARVKRILGGAELMAHSEQNERVTERHIMLSFLREGGGVTASILDHLGVDLQVIKHNAEVPERDILSSC